MSGKRISELFKKELESLCVDNPIYPRGKREIQLFQAWFAIGYDCYEQEILSELDAMLDERE